MENLWQLHKTELFALRGINLTKEDDNKYASIYIWLDNGE